ncbi:MAG: hypothetical protein QOE58_3242 [Actinomycetota bacterium]|nr:hypothetical protein [Actinomycetota bacterium]
MSGSPYACMLPLPVSGKRGLQTGGHPGVPGAGSTANGLRCHAGLVIPNRGATGKQPEIEDFSDSPKVIVRFRTTGWRRWYPTILAVIWVPLGTAQFVRNHQWSGLAFAAVWAAIAVTVLVLPKIVISHRGVRYIFREIIPWSQVVDVVARPSRRWPIRGPVLVLGDGRRKPLDDLNDVQIDRLRSLAREHGSPIPP